MDNANISIQSVAVSKMQSHGGRQFPLVYECCSKNATLEDVLNWVHFYRRQLDQAASLHGATLFRGFPLRSAEDFDSFVEVFGYSNFPYDQSLSNAVRVNRTERIFTANEAPADVAIYLHHEMAQTPIYPSKLFFFCEQPAQMGGETPLCRSDILLTQLMEHAEKFVKDCRSKGLKYTSVMPAQADLSSGMGRSWQHTLRADSKHQAEARLTKLGYSWEWMTDDSLRATTPVLPGVRDLGAGRESFFNQLIAASQGWRDSRNDPSKAITYGDGSQLDQSGVLLAAQLGKELAFDLCWEQGDVALVDNFVTMHGRNQFQGTRKVLASLVV